MLASYDRRKATSLPHLCQPSRILIFFYVLYVFYAFVYLVVFYLMIILVFLAVEP